MNEQQQLPKVAVVIATHNNAQWLPGAIQSAARQDYPNLMIYVIDDNSTDNTVELFIDHNQYTNNHDLGEHLKIRSGHDMYGRELEFLSLKENKGPSFARNIAIDHALANGCHVVAILDADDQFLPGKISKCVAQILTDPQTIAGVYADYVHANVQNGSISYESKWTYDMMKLRQESIVHSGAVYNSLALRFLKENYGFYYVPDLTTCEDFALNRMLAQRFLFVHIAEPLTLVRVHNNSSVNYRSKAEWENNYRRAMSVQI